MTLKPNNPVAEAEHWAQVADGINRFWSEQHNLAQTYGNQHEVIDPAALPHLATPAVMEHLMALSEIVADLARMQASNFRAIKSAHDAIGG